MARPFAAPSAAARQFVCPAPEQIRITDHHTTGWNAYGYTASTPTHLPALHNTLDFVGQGASKAALAFVFSTYTDGTLVCWYQGDHDQFVVTSVSLAPYVALCRFPQGVHSAECDSARVGDCVLVCTPAAAARG